MEADQGKNVFVLGLDDFNHAALSQSRDAEHIRFHPLLSHPEVQGADAYPVDVALEKCRERLRSYPGRIDAIMGYWDFPVTLLLPLLAREFGVPAPSFESIVRCEHKYWCRREGRRMVPDHTPTFRVVDPFDEESLNALDLDTPYWIKPIKSADAELAFRVREPKDLQRFLPQIRERIGRFSEPFDHLLQYGDLPEEVARINGRHCLAEEELSGRQCTVEGYVHDGTVHVHGIIDSYRYPGVSSFLRYEYPSRLAHRFQERLAGVSRRIIEGAGLDQSTWNIEFFVDERSGEAGVLEVNPRLSQSHSDMFRLVDGASNLEIAVALALGQKPEFPRGEGPYAAASKFYLRVFRDATVSRVPSPREIARIEERFPGTRINVTVEEGARLSDLWGQDSYSYRLADIHMGASSPRRLLEKFRACRDVLPFEFDREAPDLAPLPMRRRRRATQRR